MPIFRKKNSEIRAFRLGEKGKSTPAPDWFGEPKDITDLGIRLPNGQLARWGDWIIDNYSDDLYSMDHLTFIDTYEQV